MESVLLVDGMTCKNCAAHVERALRAVAGVEDVHVDLSSRIVKVIGGAHPQALEAAVNAAGYRVVQGG